MINRQRPDLGTLAERAARTTAENAPTRLHGRTRHVIVTVETEGASVKLPGLLLDWAQQDNHGWVARVAFTPDEGGTLVVRWFPASSLTPLKVERPL